MSSLDFWPWAGSQAGCGPLPCSAGRLCSRIMKSLNLILAPASCLMAMHASLEALMLCISEQILLPHSFSFFHSAETDLGAIEIQFQSWKRRRIHK